MSALLKTVLMGAAVAAVSMMQSSSGCGYTENPLRQEGEPCTRSSECDLDLVCRGGTCRRPEDLDAGPAMDAGPGDAGADGGLLDGDVLDGDVLDGDVLDADVRDGSVLDGSLLDAGILDAAALDGAADDAGPGDAG